MANKAISELPQAQNVNNQDLFVLEQSGIAKKLPAETFITEQGIINALAEALDGHGGISSVTLASVSGRIRTYRITFTDQSATTFQVYDGTSIDRISRTSSSGLDDVYTIFLSDGTTTFFTVHNGADGNVSEAMLNDALKDKAPVITETTESSAIANFTDGADDMVMHNVVAEINPVQDLPYGAPYPAGGGKNLYSILIGADTFQINVGATFSNVDGTLKIEMTSGASSGVYATSASVIKPLISSLSGEYTLSFDIKASQSGAVICGAESLTSTSITATTSWQRFSFTNTYATPNTTFVCYNRSGNAMTVEIKNLQICLSSATDPTVYAPYSNICPITGFTGANVTRTGANLWDEEWELGSFNSNGQPSSSSTSIRCKNFIPVAPGQTYYMYSGSGKSNAPWMYGIDKSFLRRSSAYLVNQAFTIPNDVYYIKIALPGTYGTTYNNDISINYPSTDTQYHPYQGTTLAIDWTTEAGTVYGGTIDFATGLLTVGWKTHIFNGSETWDFWNNVFVNYDLTDIVNPTSTSQDTVIIADRFKPNGVTYRAGCGDGNIIKVVSASTQIACYSSTYADIDAFKASLVSNPMTVCYKLATPQTYQLTPQQLMTLLGTNNVQASTGNVSVTYPADTKMFIEKLTMPTEDDLVANQAITSGKYFMIGNSLYLALANIASGAQITIGTNAQRVSLADALNTINS